jgi:hypothetical protein
VEEGLEADSWHGCQFVFDRCDFLAYAYISLRDVNSKRVAAPIRLNLASPSVLSIGFSLSSVVIHSAGEGDRISHTVDRHYTGIGEGCEGNQGVLFVEIVEDIGQSRVKMSVQTPG